MDEIIYTVSNNLDYFILIFIRVTALLVSSPVFGRKNVPNTAKICFCILLTYVIFTAYPNAPVIKYNGILEYALLCIKEMLFGLVMGYVTTLFFSIAQTAGHIIDSQMGFGMVSVLDVQSNMSVPLTGNFLYIIMLIVFFAVNGHLQLINILQATFRQIPAGSVSLNPKLASTALQVFVQAFVLALNVAIPVIASGLIYQVAMGFFIRTVPQLNVFVVGIPLQVVLGLLTLMLLLPVYVSFTGDIFKQMFSSIEKMLGGLA